VAAEKAVADVVLAVHGGTGGPRKKLTPEKEREFRAGLEKALRAGYAVLQKEGSTSLDGVEAAVRVLEDSPEFNAGKGSVYTSSGTIEMDAAVMDGRTRKAGAVAGVTTIRNPVSGARLVMEKSAHVLLIGAAADRFASQGGLAIVETEHFRTEHRWNEYQELLKRKAAQPSREHGTVGAVAVDRDGRLAAATSTGGMAGKMSGRVGDSPLVGAGTYADDKTCAVSATGHGEFFIRYTVASDIAARMKYKGESVAQAAESVIHGEMQQAGGRGGVIALDARGRCAFSWSSDGLYRGFITRDGKAAVFLYED
jgi:L-asparaginase / beta-aspartyl-peptidase